MAAGESYATVEDMTALWRPLSTGEQERAAALLPLVSDALRQKALNMGQNLDARIDAGQTLASVAKTVTVGIVSPEQEHLKYWSTSFQVLERF